MRVTSKMFKDNPNLTPKEIMDKVSKERHKSNKRMPTKKEKDIERKTKFFEER